MYIAYYVRSALIARYLVRNRQSERWSEEMVLREKSISQGWKGRYYVMKRKHVRLPDNTMQAELW